MKHRKPPRERAAAAAIDPRQPEPASLEPLAVRPREAARALGIGLTKMRELIASGEVTATHLGTATLVHASSLRKLLGEAPDSPPPDKRRRASLGIANSRRDS